MWRIAGSFLMATLAPGALAAQAMGAFIHDGSVKRTHQGIEATVTWTHDPISSSDDPNRSFNASTVVMVARCNDRKVAWRSWDQIATHSGREVVSTTFSNTFTPAQEVEVIAPIVEALCTDRQYTSLPITGSAVDVGLPPLTLVCSAGTQEPKISRTYHVNFAEGTVNDALAEISRELIVVRYAVDSGVRTDSIDRFSGQVTMSIVPKDGTSATSISGPCEKKATRAF